jgi:hypothetical protein
MSTTSSHQLAPTYEPPSTSTTLVDDPTANSKSNTLLSSNSRSSGGSGGSSANERGFGEPAPIPRLLVPQQAAKEKNEDLVRRGSVDERSMTLGTRNRLFIANPDLSD